MCALCLLKTICWVIIFITRLRFPLGTSITTIFLQLISVYYMFIWFIYLYLFTSSLAGNVSVTTQTAYISWPNECWIVQKRINIRPQNEAYMPALMNWSSNMMTHKWRLWFYDRRTKSRLTMIKIILQCKSETLSLVHTNDIMEKSRERGTALTNQQKMSIS